MTYLFYFFRCGNLVWLHPAFPMGKTRRNLWSHQEPKLLQMFANAACGCWAPAGTHPSNDPMLNIYQRWLSEEAGITGLTHWTYLAHGLPCVIADWVLLRFAHRLHSPNSRPSVSQLSSSWCRLCTWAAQTPPTVLLLRNDVGSISISIYQRGVTEVYSYRGILNIFQSADLYTWKKYVREFKGLYGNSYFNLVAHRK